MNKTNCTVPTLIVDDSGDPVDIVEEVLEIGGDARIAWAEGVIDPHEDFEGFKAQVEAWHRQHNPQLFVGE
jgi:hypothetical protein